MVRPRGSSPRTARKRRCRVLKGPAKFFRFLGRANEKQRRAQEVAADTGMSPAAVLAAVAVYDTFFPRYKRPDYAVYPGMYCYERVSSLVTRKEFYYPAGNIRLKGYYYPARRPYGLAVVSHGLHAGADDLLPLIIELVRGNFSVFTYDGCGTYDSEGDSTVGMCQALVDLDDTLTYISSSARFRRFPLFLVGHSCGGYAATSVLSFHPHVKACAAIAAPNNCYTLILEKGEQYAGALASAGVPKTFLDAYQKVLFGGYTGCSGVKGINAAGIPVLLAHGTKDKVISYTRQSVVSHRAEIENPNVQYYIRSEAQGGHNSIWHSERSAAYRKEIADGLKALKKEKGKPSRAELAEYYKNVDHALYSEVNGELAGLILDLFKSAMK